MDRLKFAELHITGFRYHKEGADRFDVVVDKLKPEELFDRLSFEAGTYKGEFCVAAYFDNLQIGYIGRDTLPTPEEWELIAEKACDMDVIKIERNQRGQVVYFCFEVYLSD